MMWITLGHCYWWYSLYTWLKQVVNEIYRRAGRPSQVLVPAICAASGVRIIELIFGAGTSMHSDWMATTWSLSDQDLKSLTIAHLVSACFYLRLTRFLLLLWPCAFDLSCLPVVRERTDCSISRSLVIRHGLFVSCFRSNLSFFVGIQMRKHYATLVGSFGHGSWCDRYH